VRVLHLVQGHDQRILGGQQAGRVRVRIGLDLGAHPLVLGGSGHLGQPLDVGRSRLGVGPGF
jgi:hypothetical protein